MKRIAVIMFVCCSVGSSPAWAIDCLPAAGNVKDGHYSWREIDGRKCWFLRTGNTVPAKSQFRWTTKPKQEATAKPETPAKQATAPKPAARAKDAARPPLKTIEEPAPRSQDTVEPAPPPAEIARPAMTGPPDKSEPQTSAGLPLRTVRVRASTGATPYPGDHLMSGTSLTDIRPFGGPRKRMPVNLPPADFNTRFKGGHD